MHPAAFNEKVVYKILHDRRPVLTRLADKLRARDYVSERIGADYLTKICPICRSPAEIDWPSLSDRFALKTTRGSGMHVLVPSKPRVNADLVSAQLEKWLCHEFL